MYAYMFIVDFVCKHLMDILYYEFVIEKHTLPPLVVLTPPTPLFSAEMNCRQLR